MITIIDYGVGNLTSIRNMLKKAGAESVITADPRLIESAQKLILPGVGAFDTGMTHLREAPFFDILNHRVLVDRVPILGICLGVQLFTESSEEGKLPGLGWVKGHTVRFRTEKMDASLKVPHMGWTDVAPARQSRLLENMPSDARFYFVHTYHLLPDDPEDTLLTARYGYEFAAGVEFDNIVGVQFHPEKSHKFGLQLLTNFSQNYGS